MTTSSPTTALILRSSRAGKLLHTLVNPGACPGAMHTESGSPNPLCRTNYGVIVLAMDIQSDFQCYLRTGWRCVVTACAPAPGTFAEGLFHAGCAQSMGEVLHKRFEQDVGGVSLGGSVVGPTTGNGFTPCGFVAGMAQRHCLGRLSLSGTPC